MKIFPIKSQRIENGTCLGDLDDRTVGGEFESACFLGRGAADVQDFFDLVDVEADVVEPGRDAPIGERTSWGSSMSVPPVIASVSRDVLMVTGRCGLVEYCSA